MDIGHVVLKHMGGEPVSLEQEDFVHGVLGHKVDTLVAPGHRDFVLVVLDQKDFEPVDLGH